MNLETAQAVLQEQPLNSRGVWTKAVEAGLITEDSISVDDVRLKLIAWKRQGNLSQPARGVFALPDGAPAEVKTAAKPETDAAEPVTWTVDFEVDFKNDIEGTASGALTVDGGIPDFDCDDHFIYPVLNNKQDAGSETQFASLKDVAPAFKEAVDWLPVRGALHEMAQKPWVFADASAINVRWNARFGCIFGIELTIEPSRKMTKAELEACLVDLGDLPKGKPASN